MTEKIEKKNSTLLLNNYITESDIMDPFKGKVSVYLPDNIEKYAHIIVYDSPAYLPFWFEAISNKKFNFKYHVVIYFEPENADTFPRSHVGLLLFSRDGFSINKLRIPHKNCKFCGQNIKDWGGKKHLMNPEGTAVSDVWKHLNLSYSNIKNNKIPSAVEKELKKLFGDIEVINANRTINRIYDTAPETDSLIKENMLDQVFRADASEKLKEFPKNSLDLIFVDPPYNLNKNYKTYHDERTDYIEWSEKWIDECLTILKQKGSFMFLNIPKWAHEIAFRLIPKFYLQGWIVWDEPGEPRGKIVPAHYALLWFSKEKHPLINKLPNEQASFDFCSRQSCKKSRIGKVNDVTFVRDIRWDIHRVKAGKFRFNHPAQLPEKLLDFVIRLTTNERQIVLDPMSGTGTTAVVAKNLNRRYIGIDIDQTYVDVTNARLEGRIKDLIQKQRAPQKISGLTKKDIQIKIGGIALKLKRLPSIDETAESINISKQELSKMFPSWGKALSYAKLLLSKR